MVITLRKMVPAYSPSGDCVTAGNAYNTFTPQVHVKDAFSVTPPPSDDIHFPPPPLVVRF